MIDNLSIAVYAIIRRVPTSLSIDEMLSPKYVTNYVY